MQFFLFDVGTYSSCSTWTLALPAQQMQTGGEEGVEWCGSAVIDAGEICTKNIIRTVINAVAARVRVLIFSA